MNKISIKKNKKQLVFCLKNRGNIEKFNQDIDKTYRYIYERNLQSLINGPTIGLFFSKEDGNYMVAIPIKNRFKCPSKIFLFGFLLSIKVISTFHMGEFKTINNTFSLLFEEIKRRQLSWYFPVIEKYHFLKKEKKYQTEILIPIEKKEAIKIIS